MLIDLIVCAAAVFTVSAIYFERRRRALEAHMTKQVKERYAAYIELEERVRDALGEFDRLESSFEIEIRKSREQIKSLEEALNTVEGVENNELETPGGFLGVLDEGDANVLAQPITLTGEARDFEAELQNWERKVEATQNEKRNEIERQRQQIAELTARVRQLEPNTTAVRLREEALTQARLEVTRHERIEAPAPAKAQESWLDDAEELDVQARPSAEAHSDAQIDPELEERIDKAEETARDLVSSLEQFLKRSAGGISGLRETLASCKPLLEQQAKDHARVNALERERNQLQSQRSELENKRSKLEIQRTELEKSCASLEERCGALDSRLRERDEEVESAKAEAEELENRNQESARRLETANEELNTLRHDLENEREHVERESLAREELERAREELVRNLAQLRTNLDEESTRSAGLVGELDGARARLESYEKQHTELEARASEQSEVLQAQTDMLRSREDEIGRLRNRVAALESKMLSTRDTIGGQKSRLVELMEAIDVAQREQNRHQEILTEQSAHMQEARKLLSELRPVMDTLEGDLEKKQTAESASD
ncbi:MAG: hypothetical protein IPJ19_05895 [Planctomycetes bacterium]|nr:hypothetical protein [Planctomycetota bacterium]